VYNGPRVDHSPREEAEKPFWISYADLMTSLMVLFLVVMLASLVTLTRTVTDLQDTQSRSEVLAAKYKDLKRSEARRERLQGRRRAEIDRFWTALEKSNRGLGIRVDRDRQSSTSAAGHASRPRATSCPPRTSCSYVVSRRASSVLPTRTWAGACSDGSSSRGMPIAAAHICST
jgi:Tfp pilus assembly protein PilV